MTLSAQSADRILELYEVARQNGSLMSLREILVLLPEEGSVDELERMVSSTPILSSRLELKAGFVVGRNHEATGVHSELQNRGNAFSNLKTATRFASFTRSREILVVAVSGSTSYRSASKSKDLDFFCITRPKVLWVQLTRLLLVARFFRIAHSGSPEICFSCMTDSDYAGKMFNEERTAIFARDALQTEVMVGKEYYQELLAGSGWIHSLFPSLYTRRVSGWSGKATTLPSAGVGSRVLNRFLYITVGTFIKMKGQLLNMKLRGVSRQKEMFELLMGEDHLMYESLRYKSLRDSYRESSVTERSSRES